MRNESIEIRQIKEQLAQMKQVLAQAVEVIEQQSLILEHITNHLELDGGEL